MFVVGRDDEGDGSYGAVQWEKTEKEPRFSIGRVRRDPQLGAVLILFYTVSSSLSL